MINTYCWISYTFTLPHEQGKHVGTEVAHPGLGNDNQQKTYHSYYQWVPFVLFFQGVLFYMPHLIWKVWEEDKVRMISEGMRGALVGAKEEREKRQSRLVQYLVETLHMHNTYAFGYFACEFLNLVNVVRTFLVLHTSRMREPYGNTLIILTKGGGLMTRVFAHAVPNSIVKPP